MADPTGTTTFAYDGRDRLTTRTGPDGRAIAYQYDAAGNRTAIVTPAGTTAYTFDALNRTATVTDPTGGKTAFAYDLTGNRTRTAFADGTVETRTYDARDRLLTDNTADPNGALLLGLAYTPDPSGQRTAVAETGPRPRQVVYGYDPDRRLTAETVTAAGGPATTTAYTYDAAGNRLTRDDPATGRTTYGYDAGDRLLTETIGGSVTAYTYDGSGDTLTRTGAGGQEVDTYTSDGRLATATVTAGGTTHTRSYRYSGDGLRVAAVADGVETRYLVDANRPYAETVQEYTPAGVKLSDTVADDAVLTVRQGGVTDAVHADAVGTTRLVTAGGAVVAWATGDAFGQTLASGGTAAAFPGFAGRPADPATGLIDMRARDYDPRIGRFRESDPYPFDPEQPATVGRFAYAADSPVSRTDPSGLFSLAEVLVSTNIASELARSYTQNLGKLFLTTIRIAACLLKPGNQLRTIGASLIEQGVPRGEVLYEQGSKILADGFKALESAIRQAYKNIANDLAAGTVARYDAFGKPAPKPNYNTWSDDIQAYLKKQKESFLKKNMNDRASAVAKFGTDLGEFYNKLETLLTSPDDCARATVLEEFGSQLISLIPKL